LLAGGALAQRRGGGGGGAVRGGGGGGAVHAGGSGIGHTGGVAGGIGRVGGSVGVGRVGGVVSGGGYLGSSGYRGYGGYTGYRNGFYNYGNRGYYGYGGVYWPYAWGLGSYYYNPYYSDYGYYPYDSGYAYQPQPNVTVVYPEQESAPVSVYSASPVVGRYDQYGQEVGSPGGSGASSPLYLIAFKDHVIRPALAYSVTGDTLHYTTLDREDKQVPLDSVDRDLSRQLNRERRVPFNLPGQ
jgi:hypothetical protein